MDKVKLEQLRVQYGDQTAFVNHTEKFQSFSSEIFGDKPGGERTLPYSGHATFLDMPSQIGLDAIDVALIGVPMDLAVSNRAGARLGPRAVRDVERIGPLQHKTGIIPPSLCRIADIGDVSFRTRYSLERCVEDIEAYYRKVKKAGIIPLTVGGDHSITYPILRALGADEPVAMIHIDAHCDTMGIYEDSKFHHGGPFRSAVLDGVLDPEKTIQIGIRGASESLWEFSYQSGMSVVHIEDVVSMGIPALIEKTRDLIGDEMPVYLTIDVDGFDPAFAPGTGTPEIGGLTSREGIEFLSGLMGMNFIGTDVVEVAPMYDPTTNTAQLGAQLLFEELCLIADCLGRRE